MYQNRRFLITQNSLRDIAGSEVVTLELAQFLTERGGDVTVYTYYSSEPMASQFSQAGITVLTSDEPEVKLADFDVVWVHHQVLPLGLIRDLSTSASLPAFIFHHMSRVDLLESPHIYDLEKTLSCLSLFVSPVVEKALKSHYDDTVPTRLFRNYAPVGFSRLSPGTGPLTKVLVVSNHVPEEVQIATEILASAGVSIIRVGASGGTRKLITPEVLGEVDAVITIGKTVQYCLTAGVPVYVYDHFGGPGYLGDDNLGEAEYWSFSGKGFTKKSAHEIANELKSRFSPALQFHSGRREEFIQRYCLEPHMDEILAQVKPKAQPVIEEAYLRYLIDSHHLFRKQIREIHTSLDGARAYAEAHSLSEADATLMMKIDALEAKSAHLSQEIADIKASETYRAARALARPVARIKALTKKVTGSP